MKTKDSAELMSRNYFIIEMLNEFKQLGKSEKQFNLPLSMQYSILGGLFGLNNRAFQEIKMRGKIECALSAHNISIIIVLLQRILEKRRAIQSKEY